MQSKHDHISTFHDYEVHVPSRTIYLGSQSYWEGNLESGTDYAMAEKLAKNIHLLNHMGTDPITIIMNNIGGDDYHMFAMYDEITKSTSHVTIIGSGYVASAGAFIMQAADTRSMRPHARFMFHYGSGGGHNKEWEVLCEVYRSVLLQRIREKKPNFSKASMHNLLLQDTWLSADEALSLGLIDEVV